MENHMPKSAENMAALIPAAGLSSRMGHFKPLLSLKCGTFIECVIKTFQQAGISDIFVVTGNRAGELDPVIQRAGAIAVFNPEYPNGMFSSILTGIHSLPSSAGAFFVHPADIPLVRPATVLRVLNAYRSGSADILYPVYRGQRGHPTIISAKLTGHISAWNENGGLRKCLNRFKRETEEITVPDGGILMDADLPEEYENLIERACFQDIPSFEECIEFLEAVHPVDKRIINHGKAVRKTAMILSKASDEKGTFLNQRLLSAGALLHDIAKGEKEHARKGASILREFGFFELSRIVETHTDIRTDSFSPVSEAEILYIADKITKGTDIIYPVKKRFEEKIKAFSHSPEASAAVKTRWRNADIILNKIEKAAGKPMEKILNNRP